MTYQIKTLLVGAGAEVNKPFSQLTGGDYVLNTCYYENTSLYEALEEFYKGRLHDENRNKNSKAPGTYQGLYLYSPKSASFKKLAAYLCDNDLENLQRIPGLGEHLKDKTINRQCCKRLTDDGLELLFEILTRREGAPKAFENYKISELKKIPSDAYFGTIEPYFSSLINPRTRNQSFWRLINYYWTSFFAIAKPLIEKGYEGKDFPKQGDLYRYTLTHLEEVIQKITDRGLYKQSDVEGTYYGKLRDKFDNVLTTNYTGLSEHLFSGPSDEKRCIYLSGAIWQFESVNTLASYDILDESPLVHCGQKSFYAVLWVRKNRCGGAFSLPRNHPLAKNTLMRSRVRTALACF